MFEQIKKRLLNLNKHLNLDDKELDYLLKPNKIIKFDAEVGNKTYPGFRVQFNNDLGPYKGGIRFHPEVDESTVTSLAFWMTIKTSLVGIPFGGGKGGVRVNPSELNELEYEELSRSVSRELSSYIGPNQDIPAPDVYTNAKVMAWMTDEYEKVKGYSSPGVFTGKPLELGGSVGRSESTSQGGVYLLKDLLKELKVEKPSVVIEGFGNAGMNVANILSEEGFKIVGVSDSSAGVFDEKGLDVSELSKFKKEGKKFKDFNKGVINNKEIYGLECDVLIPAALSDSINKDNAKDVNSKIILELANGPLTEEADEVLDEKGIIVVPDVLANSGGVIVSYLEWVQNRSGYYWDNDRVQEELKKIIIKALKDVQEVMDEKQVSMRTACYVLGVSKIIKTAKLRGRL